MLLALLAQFSVRAPTQEEKRNHDKDAANNSRPRKRLSRAEPVDDGDEENREKRRNGRKDGRREGNEHQEGPRER